jgi:hypothetical protein
MAMTDSRRRYEGLGFSVLLSFLFLAGCVFIVYRVIVGGLILAALSFGYLSANI